MISEKLQVWRAFSFSLLPFAQSAIEGEALIVPGGTLVMTGVAEAEWNWGLLYSPEESEVALRTFVGRLTARRLPALLIAASPVAPRIEQAAARFGLRRSEDKPLMLTRHRVALPPHPSGMTFAIERVGDDAAFDGALLVSGQAWGTPAEVMARVYRWGFLQLAGVEIHAALIEGEMVSYVFSVPVGDVVWLGDLGTVPRHRGKGAAAALLNAVMDSYRERGWSAFGLGADPPGVALYERLGFETLDRAAMWVCA